MKVHHAGKNGDLVYALPVIKALARQNGPITLVTSPHCFQIVPLLWEQPYISDVEMDYSRSYHIDKGSMIPWNVLGPEEGINLSPQPSMYRPNAPQPWTLAYAEIAGVEELSMTDRIALPSLWNHRQWYWEHRVQVGDKTPWEPPKTVVLAPESESIKTVPLWVWRNIAMGLAKTWTAAIIIGVTRDSAFDGSGALDLRGMTTVGSAAKIMAEASVVVSSVSLPLHLARHAGTPTFCLQDQYLERSAVIDTPIRYYVASQWEQVIDDCMELLRNPRTTLWSPQDLEKLQHESHGAAVAA